MNNLVTIYWYQGQGQVKIFIEILTAAIHFKVNLNFWSRHNVASHYKKIFLFRWISLRPDRRFVEGSVRPLRLLVRQRRQRPPDRQLQLRRQRRSNGCPHHERLHKRHEQKNDHLWYYFLFKFHMKQIVKKNLNSDSFLNGFYHLIFKFA